MKSGKYITVGDHLYYKGHEVKVTTIDKFKISFVDVNYKPGNAVCWSCSNIPLYEEPPPGQRNGKTNIQLLERKNILTTIKNMI